MTLTIIVFVLGLILGSLITDWATEKLLRRTFPEVFAAIDEARRQKPILSRIREAIEQSKLDL